MDCKIVWVNEELGSTLWPVRITVNIEFCAVRLRNGEVDEDCYTLELVLNYIPG